MRAGQIAHIAVVPSVKAENLHGAKSHNAVFPGRHIQSRQRSNHPRRAFGILNRWIFGVVLGINMRVRIDDEHGKFGLLESRRFRGRIDISIEEVLNRALTSLSIKLFSGNARLASANRSFKSGSCPNIARRIIVEPASADLRPSRLLVNYPDCPPTQRSLRFLLFTPVCPKR